MAYLSMPKIFRHLTFLHLSSPFIVDNCSHISNLSFAITYIKIIKENKKRRCTSHLPILLLSSYLILPVLFNTFPAVAAAQVYFL